MCVFIYTQYWRKEEEEEEEHMCESIYFINLMWLRSENESWAREDGEERETCRVVLEEAENGYRDASRHHC